MRLLHLLEQERVRLLRHAFAITKSTPEAEDVLQEVALTLMTRPMRPVREPIAYLRRMVGNVARNRWRTERREREMRAGLKKTLAPVPGVSLGGWDKTELLLALDILDLPERSAVTLRVCFDFSLRECAQWMAVAEKRASALCRRGLRALQAYRDLSGSEQRERRANGPTSLARLHELHRPRERESL